MLEAICTFLVIDPKYVLYHILYFSVSFDIGYNFLNKLILIFQNLIFQTHLHVGPTPKAFSYPSLLPVSIGGDET